MIDPTVERYYSDCRELMELWRHFHDFFKLAVVGKEIAPEKEHEFISIKSRIAMLHDSFMDCLEHDQNIGQNVLSIVTRSITLKHVHRMSTAEIKKIELEWHETYLLLNETIGVLEEKRNKFAQVKPSVYYRKLYVERAVKELRNFVAGWVFKGIVAVVILIVGIFLAIQFDLMGKLVGYGPTRNLVLKFEDLIRIVHKNYVYRDLTTLRRMDKLDPQFLRVRNENAQTERNYNKDAGISRVDYQMRGNPNNIANDLRAATAVRTEIYDPELFSASSGGEGVVWLFLMPSTQLAQGPENKYKLWQNERPRGAAPDWILFRRANVIGVVFGGDDRVRTWARDQFLHIRQK